MAEPLTMADILAGASGMPQPDPNAVTPGDVLGAYATPKAGKTIPPVNARPMTGQAAAAALGIPDITTMTPGEQQGFALGAVPMLLGGPEARAAQELAPAARGALDFWNREIIPTVSNPQRMFAPGIYQDPRTIVATAAQRMAPEDPALRQLFGVTRSDLSDIGQAGARPGNIPGTMVGAAANPKGSYVAENVMNPANAQRLIDVLAEGQKTAPDLTRSAYSWYVMDPAYRRLESLLGPANAPAAYERLNTLTSMASPASDVLTEINRGTAAHMMAAAGRFPEFVRYGGKAGQLGAPPELADVLGHPYHSTSQAAPMARYLQSGAVEMSQPKVPNYILASGVPETGFQTTMPVPDAHFGRALGVADVRTSAQPGVSLKWPEYGPIAPWFREQVAQPMGIQAVPAQAATWTLFAPQTGVESPVGAGKLELLAGSIAKRAGKLGVDPQALRDAVLRGTAHASVGGGLGLGGALMAAGSEQAQAGEVVPMTPQDPRRGTAEEWNKRLTRATLMRALGGSENVLPMTPQGQGQ